MPASTITNAIEATHWRQGIPRHHCHRQSSQSGNLLRNHASQPPAVALVSKTPYTAVEPRHRKPPRRPTACPPPSHRASYTAIPVPPTLFATAISSRPATLFYLFHQRSDLWPTPRTPPPCKNTRTKSVPYLQHIVPSTLYYHWLQHHEL